MSVTLTCPVFANDLERLHSVPDLVAYLKEWHGRINTPNTVGDPELDLLTYNTALVDAVLRRLFICAVEKAREAGEPSTPSLAIVATGGYGRRELSPFSDVDVTFVSAREDDPELNAIIKEMFQSVMDVFLYGAGLKVGYAYRLLGDLGQLDHQTQTALLDARFLCGDQDLFREFRHQFRAQLLPLSADFLFQKWAEREAVLSRHGGDQPYRVEPQVKEGAGGLRDIQTAEWMGEVRFHVGLSRLWPTLIEHNFVTPSEAEAVQQSRGLLWRVRSALHVLSGEARDVLTPEKQEAVAAMLRYADAPDVPAVETFMRDFYAHAARARRISRKAVTRILDSPLPLGLGLSSVGRALVVSDPDAAGRDVALPLHMAELAQAYGLAVSPDAEDAVLAFLERHPVPADPILAGRVLTRLLTAGRDVADTLDRLEGWGVLAWLLPEFGVTVTLIPYDAAHDYTVGAHSLRVVRFLEMLRDDPDPRLSTLRRVLGEVAFPEVLFLAGLIHDVGKQWSHGPHAETGAEAAITIGERLGWDAERTGKLNWLVRRHLLMAETSRLRDLALTETVREFLRHVPDLDALNMLYLLTYADTRAVGEGVWTDVNGRFLGELYHRAEAVLAAPPAEQEPGASPPAAPTVARQRERIRRGLAKHDLPPDLVHEHTRNLPAQYLLNTPVEEMYLHIAMINRLRETFQPIVDFKTEYGAEYTELTLCAFDDPKPGLLAKITGVLYACDVNVHAAQVFTREASVRIALDTLWVDYRGRPLTPGKKTEVQDSLRRVLLGEQGVGELLKQRRKPLKEQTIYSAAIDDTASDRFSLLEISSPDERGVLYRLTRAISQLDWNIHAARLSVWGSRARDAFYITDVDSRKVPPQEVERLRSSLPMTTLNKKTLVKPEK